MLWPALCKQVLRRFGRFASIKLEPSPKVAELVLLELKAELIAGSLQVRSLHATEVVFSACKQDY